VQKRGNAKHGSGIVHDALDNGDTMHFRQKHTGTILKIIKIVNWEALEGCRVGGAGYRACDGRRWCASSITASSSPDPDGARRGAHKTLLCKTKCTQTARRIRRQGFFAAGRGVYIKALCEPTAADGRDILKGLKGQ
jgi:hypothetical protein